MFWAQQNSSGLFITCLCVQWALFAQWNANHKWTWIRVDTIRLFRKERDLYILLSLLLFSDCRACRVNQHIPEQVAASPSQGSSRAPDCCWRSACTVGVSAEERRGSSLMSSVAIPPGVPGQPQTPCCRVWSAEGQTSLYHTSGPIALQSFGFFF